LIVPTFTSDRRAAPRIGIVGWLSGRVAPGEEPVSVSQIGETGMQVETSTTLSPLATYEFRFSLDEGRQARVLGRTVHGRFDVRSDGVHYTYGVQFVEVDRETAASLKEFIAALPG
jgi:hypothetical protein